MGRTYTCEECGDKATEEGAAGWFEVKMIGTNLTGFGGKPWGTHTFCSRGCVASYHVIAMPPPRKKRKAAVDG